MILNYEAFAHPKGECFCFPAKDDDDARYIMEDYLRRTKQFRASVYRWKDDEDDQEHSMYARENEIKIEIPEGARPQSIEYKFETRYIKYVKYSSTAGEDAFAKAVRALAPKGNTLPEHPGWEKRYRAEPVFHTDDERYGATVEEQRI